MSAQLPDWKPVTSGHPPPATIEPGHVVGLLAPSWGTGESWAAGLAFELASQWADEGHKIVLADAALEHPSLHEEAELSNGEGLVDAAWFGASVARIAQAVPRRPFFLVTAGSPTADGEAVARSPRIDRLIAGFREAGVTLLLFVREGGGGSGAFLDFAHDVVVLGASPEALPDVPDSAVGAVRAVLGPEAPPAAVREPVEAPEATGHPGEPGRAAPDRDAPAEVDAGASEMVFGPPGDAARESSAHDGFEAGWRGAENGADEDRSMGAVPPEAAPTAHEPSAPVPGVHARGGARGASSSSDPDGRRKLLLVAVVVLLIALLVVFGALRG